MENTTNVYKQSMPHMINETEERQKKNEEKIRSTKNRSKNNAVKNKRSK